MGGAAVPGKAARAFCSLVTGFAVFCFSQVREPFCPLPVPEID